MAPSSDMGGMGSNPDAYPVKSMGDYSDAGPDGHHQDQGGMDQGHYNGNGNGANDEEPKQEEAPKTDSFDLFGSMLSKMPAKEEEEKKEEEEVKKEENNDKKDAFDSMFDSATKEEKDEDEEEKKDNTEDGDEETKPEGEEGSTKEDKEKSEDAPAATTIADNLDDIQDGKEAEDPDADIDMVVEIKASDKILSDEKYYESLKPEELEAIENAMPSIESFYTKLECSVCGKKIDPVIGSARGVLRHPHLGTPQCQSCRNFYGDGDWPRSEDGDEYCRMCSNGGDILLCDKFPNAFCNKCLARCVGGRALREITKSEEWACLLCDPTPIIQLKATYMKLYKCQEEIKERRANDRKEANKNKSKKKEAVSKKEKDALVKSPKNFLEENISEAFKTLEVYQKALETERTRCIKGVKEGMTVDTSTSITRKLRKLYAVTQKNMDLLDRAIVESFVENFPTESTRIHMGRVAPPPQPKYAAPAKRGAKGKKKPAPRGKVKIKPKKGKGPVKGKKKGVIELNGAPDYVEYDLPKKRKGVYRDDDVECIDVSEDDEYYNPKKRSRPGPASSKKGKPGPASKKRW